MSHLQGPSKIFLNEPFDCSEDMSTGPLQMMPWPCKKCKKNSSTRAYGEPCWHYEGKIAIAIGTFSFKYILIVHCNIYAMVTWTARGLADLVEDVNKLSCWVSASFAAGSLPGVRKGPDCTACISVLRRPRLSPVFAVVASLTRNCFLQTHRSQPGYAQE